MDAKKVSQSITHSSQIVMAQHINGSGRLFGGQLMQWIDILGGVVARRHSEMNVTTAAIDDLEFLEGAHMDDVIFMVGQITYAGRTSMEIKVSCYIEKGDLRTRIATAYLVYVGLDSSEKPALVPKIEPETEEEKLEYEAAILRRQLRLKKNGEESI